MKAHLLILPLFILSLFVVACSTPVAIDPTVSQEQTARYQAGFFYGPIQADALDAFNTAIRQIDKMGYFRTGELHKDSAVTIYARKVGDEKVYVRIEQIEAGLSEMRIRVGAMGNLAESQTIYAKIRNAL